MDDNELIAYLQSLHEENTLMKLSTKKHRKLTFISSDYASEDIQKRLIQENGIAYFAGYLLQKTYNIHKCDKCSLLSEDDADISKLLFLIFKAYESDSSMY